MEMRIRMSFEECNFSFATSLVLVNNIQHERFYAQIIMVTVMLQYFPGDVFCDTVSDQADQFSGN